MLIDYYKKLLNSDEINTYNDLTVGLENRKNNIKLSSILSRRTLEAISYSNPELYYVDFTKINYTTSVFGTVANIHYFTYDKKQIKKRTNQILSQIKHGSDELVVRQLHNYFVKNVKYDEKDSYRNEYHNIVGIFAEGKGVCEGIARAFQYLLNVLKIDNTVVTGTYDGAPHMWNVVNVDGLNYHIDVTADITLSESSWSKPGYFYYLLTDKEIMKTHIYSGHFLCYSNKDNLFFKNKRLFSDVHQLANYIKSESYKDNIIYFKYVGNLNENEILRFVSMHWKGKRLVSKLYMKHFLDTYYFWR